MLCNLMKYLGDVLLHPGFWVFFKGTKAYIYVCVCVCILCMYIHINVTHLSSCKTNLSWMSDS